VATADALVASVRKGKPFSTAFHKIHRISQPSPGMCAMGSIQPNNKNKKYSNRSATLAVIATN
jgi:hypothetical protein